MSKHDCGPGAITTAGTTYMRPTVCTIHLERAPSRRLEERQTKSGVWTAPSRNPTCLGDAKRLEVAAIIQVRNRAGSDLANGQTRIHRHPSMAPRPAGRDYARKGRDDDQKFLPNPQFP
ncbi:uncharacterized protein CIMG_12836 [Coccidioides immitis RS]|uniref:Uncharacterized protein n=2 Tax=Coccidioides immitis TaxID=5501 RepID=J3KHQ5_COCIM|nr:uncharacterized protein CIMG_12836 [Coccidioides immitis RS]EAS35425.3 hypothetical protein CIMG_12836 [Coccidioides immitis RS]KMU78212.1 hypothetical protein CISG_07052 [Coccidioides immitis RMSCC 3703]